MFARTLADGVEDLIRFDTAAWPYGRFGHRVQFAPDEDFQAYPPDVLPCLSK